MKNYLLALIVGTALLINACEQVAGSNNSLTEESGGENPAAQKTLTAIKIASPPDTTLYPNIQPYTLDLTGLAVEGIYDDDSSRALAESEYTVGAIPNPDWTGLKTITVTSVKNPELSAQFKIVIDTSARVLQSITVNNAKPVYDFGDDLDRSKLTITGYYSDTSSGTISADCSITGYDNTKRGAQTVTARVNGKGDVFTVTVKIPADAEIAPNRVSDGRNTYTNGLYYNAGNVYKPVYIKGQTYDITKSNLKVTVTRRVNGRTISGVITASNGLTQADVTGYTSTAGTKTLTVTLDEKSAAFPVEVVDMDPEVYFDYGYMRTAGDPQGKGAPNSEARYTVPQGRSIVLAPVRMLIGYDANHNPTPVTYSWTVTSGGAYTSGGANSECFTFTPGALGDYTVKVTVTGNNFITQSPITKDATAKVVCTAALPGSPPAVVGGESPANGPPAYHLRDFAPGQFTESGSGYGWSLGGWGGYEVWKLRRTNSGSYDITITGNPMATWSEPGTVWVAIDEERNGKPGAWYELKGGEEGRSGSTKRYGLSYFYGDPSTPADYGQLLGSVLWADCKGRTGALPAGWPSAFGVPGGPGAKVTYSGTLLRDDGKIAVGTYETAQNWTSWGYVDCAGGNRFRISDAIKQDGTPANLPYIDFVKVQTAVFQYGAQFGEVSTEIVSADGLGSQTNFPMP